MLEAVITPTGKAWINAKRVRAIRPMSVRERRVHGVPDEWGLALRVRTGRRVVVVRGDPWPACLVERCDSGEVR
jgi:hypothetical protein